MIDAASRLRLEDMLKHARLARDILGSLSFDDVSANDEKRLALERAVEVVGEAANFVSSSIQLAEPSVPWRDIIAMRHRLIHGYAAIDFGRLVRTVQEDIPPLIAELERILNTGA